MLGIDKRLIVKSTGRWIVIGITAGILNLFLSIALYTLLGRSVDGALAGQNLLLAWLPWIAALLAAKALAGWLMRTAQYKASADTKLSVRDLIYRQALRLGPALLGKERTGEIVNTAVDGIDWLENFYGIYFVQFVIGMATPILLCLYIASVDWAVGLALVISIPLTPLFLGAISRLFKAATERFAAANRRQSAQFLDAIQGMSTLKMFNLGRAIGEQIHRETEAQRRATMRLLLVNQISIAIVDFGFALGTTLILLIVALLRFDAGALSLGEVVALVLISAEFSKPLSLIGEFFFAGAIGRAIAKKVLAFLDLKPDVEERAVTAPPALKSASFAFDDVTFAYEGAERPVLQDFSLTVGEGETVAVIGRSGAGKTTLTNLLLRTLAPQSGTIRIGPHDVRDVPIDWVRAHIALVPQDPYLFYGTIADNLRVAKPDASLAELENVARAANIYDFIAAAPDGFDTRVGERGASVSGGQAQRIAIARALLKDAPIVLLDEPTSQIDLETESDIHEALARLTADKTVLLIAHRLSTVENADRIVVMESGRIVEQGSHSELLALQGAYARMHQARRAAERLASRPEVGAQA